MISGYRLTAHGYRTDFENHPAHARIRKIHLRTNNNDGPGPSLSGCCLLRKDQLLVGVNWASASTVSRRFTSCTSLPSRVPAAWSSSKRFCR